jgi:hypothetical protein
MLSFPRVYTRFISALTFCTPFAASLAACDSNVEEKLALARLAQSCLVNSDCAAPLVCAFEACHAECESSRDCDPGARCVAAARPYKVCQLEEERVCERTSDCAEGLVCGVDDECRDQCLTGNDCVEGQRCVSGTCADTSELDASGQLEPAAGQEHGREGSPCVYVSDCSAALLCRSQACLPQCKADKDCPEHQLCQETRCVPDGSQPIACQYNSDCETERGERCLAGNCLCACAEDRDCPSGQSCDGCGCIPAPTAAQSCVYNSDCDEPGQLCQNRTCACECQADADCGEEERCDGCGCVDERTPLNGIVTGNVIIESSLQLGLYRGVTEIHGDLIMSSSAIADLGDTFDQLRFVEGQVSFYDNQQLAHISFPALERASQFSVSYAINATRVELPLLISAYLNLSGLQKLETLRLDSFQTGSFQVYGPGRLTSLSLPAAKELATFELTEALLLTELNLPELTNVRERFNFGSSVNNALAKLDAPKLKVIGEAQTAQVRIDHTQLVNLDGFGAPGWKIYVNSLEISNNSALDSCKISAFIDRFKLGGFTASASAYQNLTCAVCDGAVCKD